jgi:heme-degrading monooxygenase HmoA
MYVRIAQAQDDATKLDGGIEGFRELVVTAARQLDGFAGAMFLVDRSTGKAIGLTMWDTKEAREESLAAIQEARARALQEVGSTQNPEIELYDVAVFEGFAPAASSDQDR